GADGVDPVAAQPAYGDNRDAAADRGKLDLVRDDIIQVRFGEQHDSRRATLVGDRQQTFDAPGVEVRADSACDQNQVDVGSEHLHVSFATRCVAPDGGSPWKDMANLGQIWVLAKPNPVPNADRTSGL